MSQTDTNAARNPALDNWGGADFDRDNPFPLFADVLAVGPIHEITLPDGHKAVLILGYKEAKAALLHPDLPRTSACGLSADCGHPGRQGAVRRVTPQLEFCAAGNQHWATEPGDDAAISATIWLGTSIEVRAEAMLRSKTTTGFSYH